jgi:RHS repeat-associated protein
MIIMVPDPERYGKNYGYAFDPIGNIVSDGSAKYAFNNLNQIVKADVQDKRTVFEYDPYGNLIKDVGVEYKYDLNNRLVEVKRTGVLVRYGYDPIGQRTSSIEIVDGKEKTTKFLMSGMIELARVIDGKAQFHTFGLDLSGSMSAAGGVGAVIASTEYSSSQSPDQQISKSFNYLYDGNGNVIASCSLAGEITNRLFYSPFGGKTSGAELPFEFSTKAVDASKLAYYGFRFYNAGLGRWMSRDQLEEEGGLNLYGMISNNLICKYDFLGLAWWEYIPGLSTYVMANANYKGTDFQDYASFQPTERECKCAKTVQEKDVLVQTCISGITNQRTQYAIDALKPGSVSTAIDLILAFATLKGFGANYITAIIGGGLSLDALAKLYIGTVVADSITTASETAKTTYCKCP